MKSVSVRIQLTHFNHPTYMHSFEGTEIVSGSVSENRTVYIEGLQFNFNKVE